MSKGQSRPGGSKKPDLKERRSLSQYRMQNGRCVRKEDCVCVISEIEAAELNQGLKLRHGNHTHVDRSTALTWAEKVIQGQPDAFWVAPRAIVRRWCRPISPAALTQRDAEANAGIGSEGAVRRARVKVSQYSHV
jgi:hypothetical protein